MAESDTSVANDRALVGALLKGEAWAERWARDIAAQVAHFYGYSLRFEQRADVVQDTLLHLTRALKKNPDMKFEKRFEAFVRSIAHRRCIDTIRRDRPTELLEHEPPSGAADPERSFLEREERSLFDRVLDLLDEGCRELLRLHATGLSYEVIAARLGQSAKALRVKKCHCVKAARVLLENLRSVRGPRTVRTARGS